MSAPRLHARGMRFGYRAPLLTGIDVRLAAGECLAVLGANGAGKTTLLRLLAGLREPDDGVVELDGTPLSDVAPAERARAIGYLPQGIPSARGFAVYEVVLMGLYALLPARGWEGHREWRAVVRALRRVGARALLRRPFHELSGGEQRRVLLARALVADPRVLVLDEPLASLDPGFALELRDRLLDVKEDGVAVVVASHSLGLARTVADRVLMMKAGQAVASGRPVDVMTADNLDRIYETDHFGRLAASAGEWSGVQAL